MSTTLQPPTHFETPSMDIQGGVPTSQRIAENTIEAAQASSGESIRIATKKAQQAAKKAMTELPPADYDEQFTGLSDIGF